MMAEVKFGVKFGVKYRHTHPPYSKNKAPQTFGVAVKTILDQVGTFRLTFGLTLPLHCSLTPGDRSRPCPSEPGDC